MASDTRPPISNGRVREKVALKPGFHLADWMRLSNSMSRSIVGPRKISLSELSEHSSTFDCWTAYKGKVYNISNYIPYHPGGAEILKKAAGKDCSLIFDKYHKWVNCEQILGKCIIGTLQTELDSFADIDGGDETNEVNNEDDDDVDDANTNKLNRK
jgi:cytochrome-b5 reductase